MTRFCVLLFFFSSRRRHTRLQGDWSSDVCSSDLGIGEARLLEAAGAQPAAVAQAAMAAVGRGIVAGPAEAGVEPEPVGLARSEERRVGKGWRWRGWRGEALTERRR